MANAVMHDTVRVHYTGTLTDGNVFDSSRQREPLEFTIGNGMVLAGFEQAVIGMEPGDKKLIALSAKDAYGEHSTEFVTTVNRAHLPDTIIPEVGMMLQMQLPEGGVASAVIRDLSETMMTLDFNHPLAGRDLNFDIELMEIVGK